MSTDIDEENEELMQEIAEAISARVPQAFPELEEARLHYSTAESLRTVDLALFLNLVKTNLDKFYIKHHGKNWMEDKQEEMLEPGLVYVWYTSAKGLIGFVSFKLCNNDGLRVLYLYEIHVSPIFQDQKIGSKLLHSFHELIPILDEDSNKYLKDVDGTNLTVFSDNSRALQWYFRQGYTYTSDSPRDRKLRGGKVVKADFYLLHRESKQKL